MANLVDSIKSCGFNKILGIRDKIGANLKNVFIVTRTWSGTSVGEGTPIDSSVQVLPSPHIVDYSHNIRIRQGGNIQRGDLVLKSISKETYATQSEVDSTTSAKNIEKMYRVGERMYQIIHVKENHLTWEVHVRELTYQERFDP